MSSHTRGYIEVLHHLNKWSFFRESEGDRCCDVCRGWKLYVAVCTDLHSLWSSMACPSTTLLVCMPFLQADMYVYPPRTAIVCVCVWSSDLVCTVFRKRERVPMNSLRVVFARRAAIVVDGMHICHLTYYSAASRV